MDLHDRKPPTLSEVERATDLGVKLAGRYRLTSPMSRSGLADLWKAEDEVLGRPVVAKMLRAELSADGAVKRLFRAEALAAARLTHSNIISVFDTGEHNGVPFLVMEYLGGGSLRQVLDNGPINPLRAAEWGGDVAAALAHAHEAGIVHRDIRPENILFTETGHLKVTDFAIAKAAARSAITGKSTTGPHSPYACPEREPDGRGDLYSLGVVLFECLVGETPDRAIGRVSDEEGGQTAPRPGALRPGVPMELDAAVMKLLAWDPAKRFQSAAALRATLLRLLDDFAAAPAPVPAPPPPARAAPPGRATAPERAAAPSRAAAPARFRATAKHRVQKTAPPARHEAPARDSFLRTEGRWLLPTVLVIVAAVALALALPSVRSGIDRVINAPGESAAPVEVGRGFVWDPPPGDGGENSDRIRLAFDGNDATSWATSSYRTADFGRLKDGVGLAFDLGEARELAGIRVTSVAGGWSGSLRFSDDGRSWSPASGQTVDVDHTFRAPGEPHRYWMIWLDSLVQTPGEGTSANPYAVAIKEVQALGEG